MGTSGSPTRYTKGAGLSLCLIIPHQNSLQLPVLVKGCPIRVLPPRAINSETGLHALCFIFQPITYGTFLPPVPSQPPSWGLHTEGGARTLDSLLHIHPPLFSSFLPFPLMGTYLIDTHHLFYNMTLWKNS